MIDLVACAVWACAVGTLGYVSGEAIEMFAADVKEYELVGLVILAIAGGSYACFWYLRERKWPKGHP